MPGLPRMPLTAMLAAAAAVALLGACQSGSGADPSPRGSAEAPSGGAPTATATAAATATASGAAEAERARPAKHGLDANGHPQPSDGERCAMCGMNVVDHKDWAGAIVDRQGHTYYFCAPRCTIASSRMSERFLGFGATEIERIRVPDYLHPERSIDAKEAYYVIDSDVRGPMGLALLPAASQEDADRLVKRHGGRVLRYDDVTIDVLKDLKARSRAADSKEPH